MYFLPVFIVLDDGSVALDAQRDKDAPGGISVLSESMFMGRALGIGVVYAVHTYGSISEQVRHNTENIIVLGAQGDDLPVLRQAMGLDSEQTAKLRSLARGEAVVYAPSTWNSAVFGLFPYCFAEIDTATLRLRAERFLQGIVAEVGGPQDPVATTDAMDPCALRLAVEVAHFPYRIMTSAYQRIGLDRDAGRSALEWLHSHGYAAPHKVSAGKRGGQPTLLEITDLGWQELNARGFPRPAPVTRGKFLHNAAALAIGELGKREGHAVYFERGFEGNVFGDVTFERRNGQGLVVHQIGLSDAKWEAKSVLRLLRSAGITELFLVVRDKEFMAKITANLRGTLSKEDEQRVSLRTVGEVLMEAQ